MPRFTVSLALFAALCLAAPPAGAQTTTYLAFGDSITNPQGAFDDPSLPCPEECGYPGRLEDLLLAAGRDAEVINRGLGGEDTTEGVDRIDQVLAEVDADVLLLMEGTNDVSQGISIETTRFNLDRMAEKAAARGMSTVHATVIPRIPDASRGDGDNVATQRLSWEIRELAFDRGRELADPFEVLRSIPNVFAEYYSPSPDAVGHPNAAGFDLLAEIFFDVITGVDSVPPVPGGVEPRDGAENVAGTAQVRLRLYDFGAGIDLAATELLIDGQPVPASLTGDPRRIDLRYSPTSPLPAVVDVGYRAVDQAPTANERTRTIATFTTRGAQFIEGDLNRDGRVDGVDLIALARAFGSVNGESRYARYVDLNRDDRVDGADLAILAANFGQSLG